MVVRAHPSRRYFSPTQTAIVNEPPTSEQASAADVAHRRTLKAALNSCVRLCVVAPTVNINLDDRSRSFCSGLPEEKIRTFVEESVLPRFTRVLLQPGSERGSGVPMPSSIPGDKCPSGTNTGVDIAGNIPLGSLAPGFPPSRRGSSGSVKIGGSRGRSGASGSSTKLFAAGVAAATVSGSTTAARASATVEDPAVEQLCLAESDDESGGGGGDCGGGDWRGGGGVGQGQGDFDKWLRDLLVDMQTSIERHVANVFQTQTAAASPGGSGGVDGGALSFRR